MVVVGCSIYSPSLPVCMSVCLRALPPCLSVCLSVSLSVCPSLGYVRGLLDSKDMSWGPRRTCREMEQEEGMHLQHMGNGECGGSNPG
jgi:hypothetical protein